MDDFYGDESSDSLKNDDHEELFHNEILSENDDLLLMDSFLREVFRKN